MDKLVNFSLLMNLCIGTIIGGFTGLCLSFIITSCLTFVSVSLIYNLYVDVCFIVIGGLMLQKVYNKNKKIDIDFGQKQKHDEARRPQNTPLFSRSLLIFRAHYYFQHPPSNFRKEVSISLEFTDKASKSTLPTPLPHH